MSFTRSKKTYNVDKVSDIPCDYCGLIGVPITFLDKYDPSQFEIVDASIRNTACVGGRRVFKRIFIRRR